MQLTGPQEAQLQTALIEAFPSRFALEQFMRYALDQNLNAIAGDVGLKEVAFRIIEWAKAESRIEALIDKARLQNPNNAGLQRFVEELAIAQPDPVAVPGQAENAATAVRALESLEQQMRNADVREAVGDFQSDFEAAAHQISVLVFYKDMHDLLHTLQFQCYRGITQEAKRFPDDATSREILSDHEVTLDGLLRQLEELALRGPSLQAELSWLQDLRDARGEFQAALAQEAAKPLTRAIWLMDRVLAVQPSQINTRLNAAARALRLGALVEALTILRDRFAAGGVGTARVQNFTDSIRSLQELDGSLNALVVEHDRWQALDLDLRRIQQNLRTEALELELSWDRVRIMLTPLCAAEEPWAEAMRATCDLVAASIDANDPVKQRQAFQRLNAQAAERFYRVDTTLKRVCENLRTVGEPLTALLRLIK